MSDAKYTKGPWIAYTDVKEPVVNSLGANYEPQIALLSEIEGESEANAHLIAAAPEMYQFIENVFNSAIHPEAFECLQKQAEKILIKARGEE